MPAPEENDKSYLAIVSHGSGFAIRATPRHAVELVPLFTQYGLSCRQEPDAQAGQETLVFAEGADRAKVQEILDGYQQAKGS
jgi:hypothetical protein